MKRSLFFIILSVILTVAPYANASHKSRGYHKGYSGSGSYYTYAKVIDVEPIRRVVEVSTPERECWQEEVHQPVQTRSSHGSGGMLMGGIIGGVIGNQIGKGHHRHTSSLAGAMIGAAVGHDIDHKSAKTTYTEQVSYVDRCRTNYSVHTEERIDGYWVSYRYGDEVLKTRMAYDPGERIRVRVRISPAGD